MTIKSTSTVLLFGFVFMSGNAGAQPASENPAIDLSCEYDKPAALNNTNIDLIVDIGRNAVTTSLDCHATDIRINDVHIAFKCGDDFSMDVDRLTGAFSATLARHERGAGHCLKIKKPKF